MTIYIFNFSIEIDSQTREYDFVVFEFNLTYSLILLINFYKIFLSKKSENILYINVLFFKFLKRLYIKKFVIFMN